MAFKDKSVYTEGLLLCLYYCLQVEEVGLYLGFIFSVFVIIIHNIKDCVKTSVLGLVFLFSWCLSEYMAHGTHFGIKLTTLCMNCINELFIKYLVHNKT